MLETLPYDILLIICEYLKDLEIINITTCSKHLNIIKEKHIWKNIVDAHRIQHIEKYFDNFINIRTKLNGERLPKKIKYFTLHDSFNKDINFKTLDKFAKCLSFSKSAKCLSFTLPVTVTHLTINSHRKNSNFYDKFQCPQALPKTLKYLKLPKFVSIKNFNGMIEYCD